ncbi:MAG: T9SS type A sorting domain-containing protein [Ignavibacteria bacterium]|nr:T9SS type A sorting domain-containing protein [Ignavibacteria bacterium]
MKRIFTLFVINFLVLFHLRAQFEYRILSPILDIESATKLTWSDIFRPIDSLPKELFDKGPDRILTQTGIEIINIINSGGGQSETFIVRHPTNPNHIVASSNDMRYNTMSSGYRMAAYYSTDGGKSWSTSLTPPNLNVFVSPPSSGGLTNVDPGLAFDSKGHLYYSYIFAQVSDQGSIEDGGVFVNKSTDGGKTWGQPIPVSLSVGGGASQDNHDKPFIACDANPNSPFKDRVYVAWYLISPTLGSAIGFSYSQNGEEFSPTTRIPGSVGTGGVQSPMPIVAGDGTLYVIWENKQGNYTNVLVQKSTNGGVSWAWSSPKLAQSVVTCGERVNLRNALPNKGNMRVSSHPYVALGNTPNKIFIVQAGKDENNKYGVYFAKSTNGGESWISKIRIDDNSYRNDMFFPAIAYDAKTGILAVSYYSSAMDSENKAVDLFVAVSFDEGNTWKNIRVTPNSWYLDHSNAVVDAGGPLLGRYWGDYMSIIAFDGKFIPCFWMPNAPRGTFYTNNAYIAILTTAPKPVEHLSYVNNYLEPNKIVLKWKDPTENQLGGILKNFTIWIYKDNEKIAEINKGIQEYTYTNLVDGETFTFKLKVVDNDGLESPFASVTGVAGGALQPKAPEIVEVKPDENGILLTWRNPGEHIDGSFFHDYHALQIFSDTTLLHTIERDKLNVGAIQQMVIPLTTKKFYKVKIRSIGKRANKLTPSEFSNEVLAYSGAPMLSLSENFDEINNLTPYLTEGTAGIWGLTNRVSFSSPNSLTDSPEGDYKPKSENYVIFAPVVLKAPNLTLSFEEIAIIDSSGDVGVISVSRDFGKSWDNIAWIDMRRSKYFKDNVSESRWFTENRSLKEYENDTVLIKFSLITNPLKNKDGWYIDNLRIDDDINFVDEYERFSNAFQIAISPNPTKDKLNVEIVLPSPAKFSLKIVDMFGNNVLQEIGKFGFAGPQIFTFSLEGLPSGVYFLQAEALGVIKSEPFIVIR